MGALANASYIKAARSNNKIATTTQHTL